MKFNNHIDKILEKLNVSYSIENSDNRICAEMEYYTDAHGYDFVFTVELGSDPNEINEVLPRSVFDYWQEFDAEDEMLPWIENRGKNGAPSSIREILRDGDECDELLEKLWNELNNMES